MITGAFVIGFVVGGMFVRVFLPMEAFYKGYFRQKQLNAGKDPDVVIREQFPILWRFF